MPDVYAAITEAEEAVQERLAGVLELRAADAQQRAMLEAYLEDLPLREGARGTTNLSFASGDGRELLFADASFDAVVSHTALCHIPSPERVLREALRVTAPSGSLAVFDGDLRDDHGDDQRA